MKIEVFGTGCAKCRDAERIMREALEASGRSGEVHKVSDLGSILAAGILSTPAVLVNGKVLAIGRVPRPAEARAALEEAED